MLRRKVMVLIFGRTVARPVQERGKCSGGAYLYCSFYVDDDGDDDDDGGSGSGGGPCM